MKKQIHQRAGWIFAASFAGIHLVHCVLELTRRRMVLSGSADAGGVLYRGVESLSTLLRYFLAGPSLGADPLTPKMWPRDIGGATLIGLFVVAVTVWLLAYYGWKRTYLYWGAALALSIALCFVLDRMAGPGISDPAIGGKSLMEVPLRCAGYVVFYQIPAWLLYQGSRCLARNEINAGKGDRGDFHEEQGKE